MKPKTQPSNAIIAIVKDFYRATKKGKISFDYNADSVAHYDLRSLNAAFSRGLLIGRTLEHAFLVDVTGKGLELINKKS